MLLSYSNVYVSVLTQWTYSSLTTFLDASFEGTEAEMIDVKRSIFDVISPCSSLPLCSTILGRLGRQYFDNLPK